MQSNINVKINEVETMREKEVEEINRLIKTRLVIEKALEETDMIDSVKSKKDWHHNSKDNAYLKLMERTRVECYFICNLLMRKRAEACVDEINNLLNSLGVEK